MAAPTSELDMLEEYYEIEHHVTAIYPDDTNKTCLLTAHANANTWSTWAEIDIVGDGETLSSKFDTYLGHISSMIIESVSEVDTIYLVEISYGSSNTIISRWRFAGTTKFQNPAHQLRVRGVHIPIGETVYYRMKSATIVADTALVHFRYFLHT